MIVGLLLLAALAGLTLGAASAWRFPRVWLACTLAGAAASLAAAIVVLTGVTLDYRSTFTIAGEPLHLRLDGISAWFLALLSFLALPGTLYSREYWPDKQHPRSAPAGRVWWNFLVLCMGLVLLFSNGLHFLIAWELFAVSAFFLITLQRDKAEVRRAGWLYLAASHAGTLCLFGFFAGLSARLGTWDLGPMHDHKEITPLFWLALAGFGLKAGLFPLHIWLPSAHANAPSHVSAILSGVAIKMGIYGLVRFTGWLPLPSCAGWVIAALGIASAVLGVAFALGQHDLKRLLAYHSVENIGIILIGLGFALVAARSGATWGILALAGALLHVWNHGLFKGLLFLGAGSVLHATGTRRMSLLGGLWQRMPWTAGLFTLGAVAIAGLPPLNGFVSEWLVYLGLFHAAEARGAGAAAALPAIIALALTGALALACFVKVVGVVFLGLPRSERVERAHECGWQMRLPMLLLAAACVVIGLAPFLFWPALAGAISAWSPASWQAPALPAPLPNLGAANVVVASLAVLAAVFLWRRAVRNGVRRAGTWDCGYAVPTARMQYTAGSFAGIITEWFAWILRPQRHDHRPRDIFSARAHYDTHTPETVLEKIVEPAGDVVMAASTAVRRLQHGRLQFYILYMMIGLVALALLAWFGGAL